MSLFKVKDINIENTLFVQQMAAVITEARGGGEGSAENIINTFLLSVPLYPASAGL